MPERSAAPYGALVTAGGHAERTGGRMPKSLLPFDSRPLVRVTVEALLAAGVDRVLVSSDRAEWQPSLKAALEGLDGVQVQEDEGFPSTFLLVRHVVDKLSESFLFLYGHSPRPVSHLAALVAAGAPAVSSPASSTMRTPLRIRSQFVEPPYWLSRASIVSSRASTWSEYIATTASSLAMVMLDGPAEPNDDNEIHSYAAWYAGRM